MPLFSVLDYFAYPAHFAVFLVLRLVCSALIGTLAVAAATIGQRYVKQLTLSWLFAIQLMIATMIWMTGGVESSYYAGLNLAVVAVGIILPAATLETFAFLIVTCGLYTLGCMAGGFEPKSFVNNMAFLVGTGVIASVGAHYLGARRYKEVLSELLGHRAKELAELNRHRSEFFANMSHELRTPLTLILAPVQELLEGGFRLPDYLAGRLGVVRENALRLLKLVNDLLDVIRIEEGREQLAEDPVELTRLLAGVVDSMSFLAEAKGLQLVKAIDDDQVLARGDRRAFEKIFVNLLSNAIKFTDDGGRVSVRLARNGDRVVIRVSDTGIGIGEEDQRLIFERFRQADGSSTRRYRGTGLGLALVKELTESMHGRISVESEPGKGTTMSVSFGLLPASTVEAVVTAEEGEDSAVSDKLEALHRVADRRGGLSADPMESWSEVAAYVDDPGLPSVLVVEDEPDMRRYLADVLSSEYSVIQARTGSEGLRAATEFRPDLVVLDLMLPEMDGLEVCREIRKDPKLGWQRIMLLTARADERSKLNALESGANDFLTKPFSTVEVLTRLRNLLENARLERDLAARNARLEQALGELERTQAQLIQSEKLNALGSLSAGLLHEINNPLNYSLTALQLLGSDPNIQGDELMREIVGDIKEGMDRIRVIVSDLRAFAYPTEAEKQVAFDLNEALEAALRFTAHERKGIEVINGLPAPALVLGSKSHLTQVLINLLTNAVKAVGAVADGRVGLIRVEAEERNGRLQVRVSDNGVGMDEQTLGRIFDPFFTTRDVGEGIGLGLSICHTIVSNHQGCLTAASRPGEGSELSFDLALADREKASTDSGATGPRPGASGKTLRPQPQAARGGTRP